jgi:hypothetical protein
MILQLLTTKYRFVHLLFDLKYYDLILRTLQPLLLVELIFMTFHPVLAPLTLFRRIITLHCFRKSYLLSSVPHYTLHPNEIMKQPLKTTDICLAARLLTRFLYSKTHYAA